jgi:hypothetical protein
MKLPLLFFLFISAATMAQDTVKTFAAVKTSQPPRIDGRPDDAVWQQSGAATHFITSQPNFGNASIAKTIVRVLYDDNSLYVSAMMYDDPANVRRQLSARDVVNFQDVDVFTVGVDTYHDRQNAFLFQVTAAGVQGDIRASQSTGGGGGGGNFGPRGYDRTWDAVWESKAVILPDGWAVEIRIPFSAIRFAKKDVQNWGLQFTRFMRRINETSTWSPENPNIDGTINQWGDLTGLKNIKPPLRLSFLPYLSGGFRNSPTNTGNVTEALKSGGMDIKYGINESFTLDMTLIPDFAQVQSDNLFLNLTPFEVQFADFRPFFTEGTELFNKAGLFYSRRIGAQPQGVNSVLNFAAANPQYEIVKNPGITRLYNATKLSGRTRNNLGVGVLNALTAPMKARLRNSFDGKDTTITTEPLTNYNIMVFDQALKNRSSVTFTNTNVLRQGGSRNANVASLNTSLFNKNNTYNFNWFGNYSTVWGKQGRKNGFASAGSFGKVSGLWQYQVNVGAESDSYDPNDMGFLQNNNSFIVGGNISYNYNKPTKRTLNHSYSIRMRNEYLYKPFLWNTFDFTARAFVLLHNFWDMSLTINTKPQWYNDYFETRSFPENLKRVPYYFIGFNGSTDSRKKLYAGWDIGFAEAPLKDNPYYNFGANLRYRFSPKFLVSLDMRKQIDKGNVGYAYRESGTGKSVVGWRDLDVQSTVLSAQYGFTPRMNLNIRMRHYWSYVDYKYFYYVKPDGYWQDKPFEPNRNRNFNVFNIDMFYTWDFLLGSRITFAWKNALGSNVALNAYENRTYLKNFGQMFSNPHSNEVTLKIVYFLDYLNLSKKAGRISVNQKQETL